MTTYAKIISPTTRPFAEVYGKEIASGNRLFIIPKAFISSLKLSGDHRYDKGVALANGCVCINIEGAHRLRVSSFDSVILTHYRQYLWNSRSIRNLITDAKQIPVIQYFDHICSNPTMLATLYKRAGASVNYQVAISNIVARENRQEFHSPQGFVTFNKITPSDSEAFELMKIARKGKRFLK